ncbi:anti-sigma factor [Pseudonocardia sp.]|uniref:anti-sigma factor domain-containing protein n=1 Tax=Pseudonocardia sp. TaxID=60912 RepID=UPI00262C0C1E|nr:anti-sigma factor [Pseudonocardia sp.]
MTTPQDCPLTQQAVGWALHALEPDEEMAVLLHLPQCAACRAAVHDAEQVLAGLGGSVDAAEPPTGMRDRLMARVADTPQRPPTLLPRPTEPAPAEVRSTEPARRHRLDAEEAAASAPTARRSWLSRRGRRLVAASLSVVAAVSLGGLIVRNAQLEQLREAESAQSQGLSELIEQLDRPGSRHAVLTDPGGAALAAVLVTDTGRQVYPLGLPANSAEQVYVAWGLNDGADPVPLGTFDVAPADQGARAVGSAPQADEFTSYAISIESGRTAPASPTRVVASGEVAA